MNLYEVGQWKLLLTPLSTSRLETKSPAKSRPKIAIPEETSPFKLNSSRVK
jgi:hypothetical protein